MDSFFLTFKDGGRQENRTIQASDLRDAMVVARAALSVWYMDRGSYGPGSRPVVDIETPHGELLASCSVTIPPDRAACAVGLMLGNG